MYEAIITEEDSSVMKLPTGEKKEPEKWWLTEEEKEEQRRLKALKKELEKNQPPVNLIDLKSGCIFYKEEIIQLAIKADYMIKNDCRTCSVSSMKYFFRLVRVRKNYTTVFFEGFFRRATEAAYDLSFKIFL